MIFFILIVKCPAPLRNRDFVYQRCWRITPDEYITFNHTVAHEVRHKIKGRNNIHRYTHTHTLSLSHPFFYLLHSSLTHSLNTHTHTQDYPPTQQFIRGISKVTGFIIRQTNEGCSACYITHADPRGTIT